MRYGEMEAAAFGDLLDTLPREEVIKNVITGLNIAYLRGAADVFVSIGKEAGNKVEAILKKGIDNLEDPIRSAVAGGMLAYQAVHEECVRQYDKTTTLGRDLIYSDPQQDEFGELESLISQLEADLAALAAEEAMNETPRDNAQIEGATAPQFEGSSIPGAESAR